MVTDKTEEEQVEALKNWWDENGTQLLIGIVFVLAGVFGYRYWQSSTQETAEAASSLYEDLVQVASIGPFDQLSDEDRATAEFVAQQLQTDYKDTTYAHFASLHMAKLAVDDGDLDSAEAALRWSLDNGVDKVVSPIVNERLARVLFAKEDYEGALAQLDKAEAGAHQRSFEELRGDIYTAMDRSEDARAAYDRALAAAENPNSFPYLQMKLHDIADPKKSISAETEEAEADEAVEGDSSES